MPYAIPKYVEARIRTSYPGDCCVIPGSTPVISFGDIRNASVATLGLNPSKMEFLDRHGSELDGDDRRLETHGSVGTTQLANAGMKTVRRVFDGCNKYFSRRPYRFWFDKLEMVLGAVNASYYSGTACHLDLIQWAADPTWRRLKPKSLREKLLEADAPFLVKQLESERIKLLLLNGRSAINGFQQASGVELRPTAKLLSNGGRILQGRYTERLVVIGWTTNLQSSFGVSNEFIRRLADTVATIYRASQK